jgi:hypothetical protein
MKRRKILNLFNFPQLACERFKPMPGQSQSNLITLGVNWRIIPRRWTGGGIHCKTSWRILRSRYFLAMMSEIDWAQGWKGGSCWQIELRLPSLPILGSSHGLLVTSTISMRISTFQHIIVLGLLRMLRSRRMQYRFQNWSMAAGCGPLNRWGHGVTEYKMVN